MTAERDDLASKHQVALSCLADEKHKKEVAIAERDEARMDFEGRKASEEAAVEETNDKMSH